MWSIGDSPVVPLQQHGEGFVGPIVEQVGGVRRPLTRHPVGHNVVDGDSPVLQHPDHRVLVVGPGLRSADPPDEHLAHHHVRVKGEEPGAGPWAALSCGAAAIGVIGLPRDNPSQGFPTIDPCPPAQ